MYIKHVLLLLPIHRRTAQKYQEESADHMANQKRAYFEQSGFSFNGLDRARKAALEEEWIWPPWLFNDIVGFLGVGSDGWNDLGCDLYLKRKHFPRDSREREGSQTTSRNNDYLPYAETPHFAIKKGDNATYLVALGYILRAARGIIRRRVRCGQIWTPPYGWSCLDLAEADRQARLSSMTSGQTNRS
jgi:hypothetical protein